MRNIKHQLTALSLLIILIALAVSGCGSPAAQAQPTPAPSPTAAPTGIKAEGRLEPKRFVQLSSAADGSISELLVKQGDAVTAGQIIARVQSANALTLEQAQAQASTQLSAAYQNVRTAQNDLDDFNIPTKFSGMKAADAAQSALSNLQTASAAFAPYKNLSQTRTVNTKFWRNPLAPKVVVETGVFTGDAYELKKRYDSAWADYRKVVQWLDLDSGLEAANVQLAQAQEDYAALQDASLAEKTAGTRAAFANGELRSPFSGTVTNLDVKVGQFAAAGKPFVTVGDLSSWVVKTTDLTEIDVVNIKEGQPVTVTLDAIPGLTLKGSVLSISENYGERQGDVVYEVTVLLTDKQPTMRWGMTAQVDFGE